MSLSFKCQKTGRIFGRILGRISGRILVRILHVFKVLWCRLGAKQGKAVTHKCRFWGGFGGVLWGCFGGCFWVVLEVFLCGFRKGFPEREGGGMRGMLEIFLETH